MAVTEMLRQDHESLRTKLAFVEEELHLMERSTALLREMCDALAKIVEEHGAREERLLEGFAEELDAGVPGEVTQRHANQRLRVGVLKALLQSNEGPMNAVTSELNHLIGELREDMAQEEHALFPAVEHAAEEHRGTRSVVELAEETPAPAPAAAADDTGRVTSQDNHRPNRLLDRDAPPSAAVVPSPAAHGEPEPAPASPAPAPHQRTQQWWWGLLVVVAIGLIGWLVRGLGYVSVGDGARASRPVSEDSRLVVAQAHAWPEESLDVLRQMRIKERDRIRPFDQFARRALSFISGQPQVGRQDPVQTVLSMAAEPERWRGASVISVPSPGARDALGLSGEATHASFDELMSVSDIAHALLPIIVKEAWGYGLTPIERDVLVVYARCLMLAQLFDQELFLIPAPSGSGRSWQSVLSPQGYVADQQVAVKRAWAALLGAIREHDPQAIVMCAGRFTMILHNLQHQWEHQILNAGWKSLPTLPH